MGEGRTNSIGEFHAMWLLLKCAIEQGIDKLPIPGDSKLLVD